MNIYIYDIFYEIITLIRVFKHLLFNIYISKFYKYNFQKLKKKKKKKFLNKIEKTLLSHSLWPIII